MSALRRFAAAAALALAAAALPAASASASETSTRTASPTSSRAALNSARAVVNIRGSNHVISFGGSISGLSALKMVASVETATYGIGVAVCSINGLGNPAVPGLCLGEQSGVYWSYWRAAPGASGFSYSGTGAGGTLVTDGAVEGWNWGGSPPPFTPFCAVAGCAPPPPPPAPSPPPSNAASTPTPAAATDGAPADGGTAAGSPSANTDAKESGDGGGGAAGDTTSTTDRRGAGDGGAREQARARGRIELESNEGGGSPWGFAAASVAVVGLGTAGFVIRRRRRPTPL